MPEGTEPTGSRRKLYSGRCALKAVQVSANPGFEILQRRCPTGTRDVRQRRGSRRVHASSSLRTPLLYGRAGGSLVKDLRSIPREQCAESRALGKIFSTSAASCRLGRILPCGKLLNFRNCTIMGPAHSEFCRMNHDSDRNDNRRYNRDLLVRTPLAFGRTTVPSSSSGRHRQR